MDLKKNFEQNYRTMMQALRTSVALIFVVIIYIFFPKNEVLWMGACTLGLAQTCIRSPRWRFELNMFFAYLITAALILLAYPFTKSPLLSAVYTFILVFLVFIFLYYKINSIYFGWTYFISQYALFAETSFSDAISNFLMCTVAFFICFFVCAVILRPKIKLECLYEMKATFKSLAIFLIADEKHATNKSEKSIAQYTRRRAEIFLHIQNLRLMANEIGTQNTPILTLQDHFIEIILEISMQLRLIEDKILFAEHVKNIFHSLRKMNYHWIKYISNKKILAPTEIKLLLEQFQEAAVNEFVKIERLKDIHIPVNENQFNEIYSIALQFKDNLSLLALEFNKEASPC